MITYSSGNHAQGVAYAARALGGEGRHRDAGECAAGEAGGDRGAGRGDCDRRAGELGAQGKGGGAGRRARLRGGSAVRRSGDHRRAGDLRAGDCGAAWPGGDRSAGAVAGARAEGC